MRINRVLSRSEWLTVRRGFDTRTAVVIEDRQIIDYFNTLIADGKKNNNLPTLFSPAAVPG